MATPSLSRSMGRSFRNSSPILLIPKSLSSGSSYSTSRRTSSGRYLPLSKDEFYESSSLLSEVNYTVQIPGSPEQETVMGTEGSKVDCVINSGDADIVVKGDQKVIPDTMFTGGFNSTPMRRILQKMMEGDPLHDPPKDGHVCSLEGCDGKVMHNEDGTEIFPCECKYPVCFDCYTDALKAGGFCPGCREQYKPADEASSALSVPIQPRMERGLSLVRSTRSHMLLSTKNFEFDHARWLYETKGTYGYGNALQSRGEERFDRTCELEFKERMTRPLSREIKVPAAIISPYRLIVLVRFLALIFFLAWRLNNPNRAAMWLWGMSVVCEVWFGFSWLLDQVPKLMPINRYTDLDALKERFERPSTGNPTGRSDLPGIDFFVSTADPDKEPPLVTANSILSILAVDYPVEKVACYLSDDCGALLTFEAMAEAASYARVWVPFCRKHNIEPRNPENYFNAKGDATKNKVRPDFVKDRRRVKREYDEFKVRINSLPDVIRRRSDACNAREEIKAKQAQLERGAEFFEKIEVPKATWMADGNYWPGTWINPVKEHRRGDHAGIIQVMLTPPKSDPLFGGTDDSIIDLTEADTRLPMLVYVSREKRPGYDHNKKAGAMNALVRASAIMSNAPFILNLDCDHYVYNSQAVREGMCFMLGPGGENICYVQFPQRFEGIDPNDRYANHNTVFFDVNLRALDGLQGPLYVGTGCLFRRVALYGFHPPTAQENNSQCCSSCCDGKSAMVAYEMDSEIMEVQTLIPRNFGNSNLFLASIQIAEMHGRPLLAGVPYGRPVGLLTEERKGLTTAMVAEAITAISCWYEEKTEWGLNIGWIYGSVTEDVVTGYQMHNRGWRSIYCVTKRDAFHGTAPVNLTDRLHQVLRWATGSVEIFFSRNNSLLAGPHMKFLQRIAYLNIGVYPFTSIFLLVYCFLPALSLFSNEFIVETLSGVFLVYLLLMTTTLFLLAMLEVRWSGITLEEWWRNEQFWLIGSTSAHLVAVLQGLLKIMAGIDISFTLTSKSAGDLHDIEEFSDLYVIKWTSLMIPPLTIMIVNLIAIPVATARTIYSSKPDWSKLLGGASFSMWVLLHLYPFAKGFMGRRGRTPTVIWVWAGLLAITISLLWVSNSSPNSSVSKGFQL